MSLPDPTGGSDFATTHWSIVVAAQDAEAPQARDALAALCRSYWYPLYAYIRRQGHSVEQAQDLTQEFFTRFLEKDYLRSVDPAKGKFRSFLLACCKHFLANERDRAAAAKRGGGRAALSLDFGAAERRYRLEPAHIQTAERLYERRWALTLLDQVLDRLHDEMSREHKAKLFEVLKPCLTAENAARSYQEVAAELGMTEGAVKVAVHRLRRRYREMLQEEVGRTLKEPGLIEEELRDLFAALA
jgi:RNA polymerase sigma-70 factor (ECF subfamily)